MPPPARLHGSLRPDVAVEPSPRGRALLPISPGLESTLDDSVAADNCPWWDVVLWDKWHGGKHQAGGR